MTFAIGMRNTDCYERAVCSLSSLIEDQTKNNVLSRWSEYSMRRELVACILGSQVRHETAMLALQEIEKAGLLKDSWWSESKGDFHRRTLNILLGRNDRTRQESCYRFPKMRSAQLARARNAIAKTSLKHRVAAHTCPRRLRRCLATDIPGVGPKQASMFIRNIGFSYDLAVLDTHVLRFLSMRHVLRVDQMSLSSISAYERVEQVMTKYADSLGFQVGHLDWAIWATMKAARELGL